MDLISIEVLYNNVSILFVLALSFFQEARISQQQRLIANHIALRSSGKCPPTSVKEFPSFLSQRRQKKMDEREKGQKPDNEGREDHVAFGTKTSHITTKKPLAILMYRCVYQKPKGKQDKNRKGYSSRQLHQSSKKGEGNELNLCGVLTNHIYL